MPYTYPRYQAELTTYDYRVSEETDNHKKGDFSQGTGIKNCRTRLDLLYPHRYTLDISESESNVFNVKLQILPN
jgi:LytS/YehU family sensor histidine kinase